MCRDSAVGIATDYGLDDRGSIPGRDKILHIVQTGSGARPASYPVGTRALSPGAKHQGREADH
jgi:hypothetical protein